MLVGVAPQQRGMMWLLLGAIRRHWLIMALCIAAGLAAAVIYLHNATYRYSVELRVTPTQQDMSSLANRFGGLAAVAGINLGADKAVSPFDLYLEAMYSNEVAERLSRDPAMLRGAFPREWDATHGRWVEPDSLIRPLVQGAEEVLGAPVVPWSPPNSRRFAEFLRKEVFVVRDNKRAIVTISTLQEDTGFGRALLVQLDAAVDQMVRRRALDRANAYVGYLSLKLSQVTLAEHREALAQALAEQERVRMMSSSRVAYAASPLGAPVVSLEPVKPKPIVILIMGFMAGAALGIAGAVALSLLRQRQELPYDPET